MNNGRSLVDKVELSDGEGMPWVGYGTYRVDEGAEVVRSVRQALEVGYRGIDTASFYGNEEGVGEAVRTSGIPREEIFLASKVWNDEQGYGPTHAAFRRSLERLRTDYLDLYLVHWPIQRLMEDTWRAMEEIAESGAARSIGVCNFLRHHLESLFQTARVRPVVDQVEHHPRLQQPALRQYLSESGVRMQAWAPTMRGRVLDIPELADIGRRHDKTAVQVSLRWMLQHGVATIPKSVNEDRIRENADIFDFELSTEEMLVIDGLDRGERVGPDPDSFAWTS